MVTYLRPANGMALHGVRSEDDLVRACHGPVYSGISPEREAPSSFRRAIRAGLVLVVAGVAMGGLMVAEGVRQDLGNEEPGQVASPVVFGEAGLAGRAVLDQRRAPRRSTDPDARMASSGGAQSLRLGRE